MWKSRSLKTRIKVKIKRWIPFYLVESYCNGDAIQFSQKRVQIVCIVLGKKKKTTHFFVWNQVLICFQVGEQLSTMSVIRMWGQCTEVSRFPIAAHLNGVQLFILNNITVNYHLFIYVVRQPVSQFTFPLGCMLGSCLAHSGEGLGDDALVSSSSFCLSQIKHWGVLRSCNTNECLTSSGHSYRVCVRACVRE